MTVLLSDAKFNTLVVQLAVVMCALIAAGASLLSARNSHGAKKNSEEAKVSAAEAANEVKTNGGMSDPNPNLNDHVKYQTTMAEENQRAIESLLHVALPLVGKVDDIDRRFTEHLDETRPLKDQLGEVLEHLNVIDEVKEELEAHLKQSKLMDKALAEIYLTVKPESPLDPDDPDQN